MVTCSQAWLCGDMGPCKGRLICRVYWLRADVQGHKGMQRYAECECKQAQAMAFGKQVLALFATCLLNVINPQGHLHLLFEVLWILPSIKSSSAQKSYKASQLKHHILFCPYLLKIILAVAENLKCGSCEGLFCIWCCLTFLLMTWRQAQRTS